jgi:hypothetical protein
MVLFLCWILFAVLVGEYASRKGLSGASFVFISLFASPLAGFLLALVSTPDREKAAQKSGLKKCSECAEYVKQGAGFCRFCGHRFAEEDGEIVVEE